MVSSYAEVYVLLWQLLSSNFHQCSMVGNGNGNRVRLLFLKFSKSDKGGPPYWSTASRSTLGHLFPFQFCRCVLTASSSHCLLLSFLDNVAGWILELDRGQGLPFEGEPGAGHEGYDQGLAFDIEL